MNNYAPTTVKETSFKNLEMLLKVSQGREFSNKEIPEALQSSLDLLKTMEPAPENALLQKMLWKTIDDVNNRLRIVNTTGFFRDYFETLPDFENAEECFNALNNYYLKTFGEYKYKDFKAFRKAIGMG